MAGVRCIEPVRPTPPDSPATRSASDLSHDETGGDCAVRAAARVWRNRPISPTPEVVRSQAVLPARRSRPRSQAALQCAAACGRQSFHQRSLCEGRRSPGRLSRANSAPEVVRVRAVKLSAALGAAASVVRARGAHTMRPPLRAARNETSRSSAAPEQGEVSTADARTAYRAPSAPAMEPLALSWIRIQRSYRQ